MITSKVCISWQVWFLYWIEERETVYTRGVIAKVNLEWMQALDSALSVANKMYTDVKQANHSQGILLYFICNCYHWTQYEMGPVYIV